METFLGKPAVIPFNRIHLDPNNPRLGQEETPGYDNHQTLFDNELQATVEGQLEDIYAVDDLVNAIVAQGWMPIDSILTWSHPDGNDKHLVVEGNTRILALRRIRGPILDRERKKLARMEEGIGKKFAKPDVEAQRRRVNQLEQILADTDNIGVVPLAADTVQELEIKLPRVLAVRHITNAKEWGSYATDLWLMQRYAQLFDDKHPPETDLFWDSALTSQLADEASLTVTKTRRQLRVMSCYSHFRADYEDQLPSGEEFKSTDYYLFENIIRTPSVRTALDLTEDDRYLSKEAEEALFAWVFKHPRGRTADDNPNVFYRHENIRLWDKMKRYDDGAGTSFAARFDASDYENAPSMREVEAEYLSHKARKKPQAVLDELIRRLSEIPSEILAKEGEFLRAQLVQMRDYAETYIRMIDAVEG